MTRLQKKILMQMINTLKQTTDQVRAAEKDGDINKLQSVLSACQESAITIGEQIEGLEGEGTATVSALEEYCEKIYETSLAADKKESLEEGIKAQEESLDKSLKCLEETVVKSTVVFMPFDARWWDGLETIWRKELSTPGTTVCVVPIPWFDIRIETGEQVRHYDLDAYPEELGAVDCDSLDLRALHPDVIYIQDGTDGTGFYRKTDDRFFTGRLKEFTDDLVYVPYKIEIEPDLKDESQMEKLSHSILVPGLYNADTVIVQSPNMRDAYLALLTGGNQEEGKEGERDWSEVIVGSGSPRAEKVALLKREDFDIPAEWIPFVKRADGSPKKIMLYGNSVYTFLKHGMTMIEKIRDSFRVFKDNSNDVALIWRPHPETGEIIKKLRPELIGPYDKLLKEFRDGEIGILDEDEDFTRSVVLSDAFYGDDSSLITIFKATGKPIMIENPYIRSGN